VNGHGTLQIRKETAEVIAYLPEVQASADTDRSALGFLPFAAYEYAAKRGNLHVAVVTLEGATKYAGYLLFGGTFPHAKIFQLFTKPEFRNSGIARQLIEHLTAELEAHSFLSISAAVAADLEANAVWERLGFTLVRTSRGGATTGRSINNRVKQLATPDLFTGCPSTPEQVRLIERLSFRTPIYAIDLNVFWDVVKHRPRADYSTQVIRAGLSNLVRVVITTEFVKELERSSKPNPTDPALAFAAQLPSLTEPEPVVLDSLVKKLGTIVFPAKAASGTLSAQDRSDLVHLATALHHQVTGFVTCERALLNAADAIRAQYGVRLLHVEELASALADAQTPASFEYRLFGETLAISKILRDEVPSITEFLDELGAPFSARNEVLATELEAAGRKRLVIRSASDIVCVASWDTRGALSESVSAWLIADDDHHAVESAIEYVIGRVCSEASSSCPARVDLQIPKGHVTAPRIAITHGFIPGRGGNTDEIHLDKVCIGGPVHSSNWETIRVALNRCSGLSFGQSLPDFRTGEQRITFSDANGSPRILTLYDLESFLSPVLFVLKFRSGCIVPIRRTYADELIGASPQFSLAPGSEAQLFRERVYFSSSRNERVLLKGRPILFYESASGRGRGSAIAVARITQTTVCKKSQISTGVLQHGVIGLRDIERLTSSEVIAATMFDNLIPLDKPVSLRRLREIGVADGSNLVTAKSVTPEQLRAILEEGHA
jgi:ribosomal protein S18 acetylase RimI-like enzyme